MSEGHNDSDLDINNEEEKRNESFAEQRTDLQETVDRIMSSVNDETSPSQLLCGIYMKTRLFITSNYTVTITKTVHNIFISYNKVTT